MGNSPDRDAVQRVRRLLESLPGVRIAWVQAMPDRTRYALAVSDTRTLGRLVHLGSAINMPLVAGVDESCQARYTHDDPGCIRYELRVPAAARDAPGEGLALVEELLIEELQRLGTPSG